MIEKQSQDYETGIHKYEFENEQYFSTWLDAEVIQFVCACHRDPITEEINGVCEKDGVFKILLILFNSQDHPKISSKSKIEWYNRFRCPFAGKPAENSCKDNSCPNTKSVQ